MSAPDPRAEPRRSKTATSWRPTTEPPRPALLVFVFQGQLRAVDRHGSGQLRGRLPRLTGLPGELRIFADGQIDRRGAGLGSPFTHQVDVGRSRRGRAGGRHSLRRRRGRWHGCGRRGRRVRASSIRRAVTSRG